jgi:sodium-dependent dicarboxylate transporter 2/3/5
MMVHALLFILKFYSMKMKKMNLDIEGVEGFDKSQCSIIVYITFAVCIILRVKASKVHW